MGDYLYSNYERTSLRRRFWRRCWLVAGAVCGYLTYRLGWLG